MIWIILIGLLVGFFFIRSIFNKNTPQNNQTETIETYNNHNVEAEERRRKTKEYDEEILNYKNNYQIKKSEAAYQLGHQYLLDSNNSLNAEKAFYFFSKSSEDRNTEAKYMLGKMYFNGQGTNKNYDKAFKIFQDLIEVNDSEDYQFKELNYYLAIMYSRGWGTYRNNHKALANAKMAYAKGNSRALEIINSLEKEMQVNNNSHTEAVNKRINSNPVTRQKPEVIVSNTKNKDSTELKSIESLDEEAKQYQLISQSTIAESHYAIGRMHYYGTVGPVDYLKSLYHFYHAAKDNHVEACFMLGGMYFDGDAVEVNYSEAFKLFSKASELGDLDADYYLAGMYGKGLGIDRDNQKAFKHAKRAAQKGDADSIALLAMNYITGTGTERDLVLARALFEKAAKQGHQKSIDTLNDSSCWEL